MVLRSDPLYAEAILFLDGESVRKEMLFVEFQAVLDGVVGIPEFAEKYVRAAYTTIWRNLSVHTVVLVELKFDAHGHVDAGWNVPLRGLSSQAISGPDLGGGSIMIMTREHCEDADYKDFLWEPGPKTVAVLTAIRDSIKRNKLGLYSQEGNSRFSEYTLYTHATDRELPALQTSISDEYQQQLVSNIESTLKFKYEQQQRTLEQQHEEIVRQLEGQNASLQEQANGYQQLISDLEEANKEHIEIIANKMKQKFEGELNKTRNELADSLDVAQMELHYSQQNEEDLREELRKLEAELPRLKSDAMSEYITNLMESGVEFIVTQSGIGSYSLKTEQLDGFLQSPTGFWAKQCNVSEELYLDWYEHYKNPACQAGRTTGCACNVQLTRVNHPSEFIPGYSDMCRVHQLRQANESF